MNKCYQGWLADLNRDGEVDERERMLDDYEFRKHMEECESWEEENDDYHKEDDLWHDAGNDDDVLSTYWLWTGISAGVLL